MTVEQGLRAEFHDRPKVLARALRAAREQGTIGDKFWGFDEDSVFNWGKTKERWLYWNAVANESLNPDRYLPEDYIDVDHIEESIGVIEDKFLEWLEKQIETIREDKDLQREHWAFCRVFSKYNELKKT